MSISFPYPSRAEISAPWLDGGTKISFACWVRFLENNSKQYVFAHGSTGKQFSLRKELTTDKLVWSVSNPEGNKLATSTTTTVVAGTTYFVCGTWEVNSVTGMVLYVNGTAEATTSTATQTSAYNSTGGKLILSARTDTGSDIGRCEIEGLAIWIGRVLSTTEITSLQKNGWWWECMPAVPSIFIYGVGGLTSRIPDWSGNDHHIEASNPPTSLIVGSLAAGTELGMWGDPHSVSAYSLLVAPTGFTGTVTAGALGDIVGSQPTTNIASAPPTGTGPWVHIATVPETATSFNVDGLTNGTAYEFQITAVDDAGNESEPSNTANATPSAPAPSVSSLSVPWRTARKFSKWKASQQ